MSDIMRIGIRSLMAFQAAIQTTAQNLENARTPFYSRRQINLVASLFDGGVGVRDVRRIFDETTNNALLRSTSNVSGADIFMRNMSEFEKVLDSNATGINKYLNDSFAALQDLTKDVGSAQSRGAYLAKLSNIAGQFRSLGADITRRKEELNQTINTTVTAANDLLTHIGQINSKIAQSPPGMTGDLLDQRNGLMHELSMYLNFNTYTDDRGIQSISLANGIQILNGSNVNLLSTQPNPADTSKLEIMLGVGGGTLIEVGKYITDGQLHGLTKVRSEALDAAERGLNRLALVLSSAFNNQNKLGVDNYGQLGGNIFTDINDPSLLQNRVIPSSTNTGSGVINVAINSPGQLTSSDYQLVFSDATHYNLVRLSDKSVVSTGNITSYPVTIQVDGFTATIASGSFNANDVFNIKPASGALTNSQVLLTDPGRLALGYPVSAAENSTNTGLGKINVDAILDTTNTAFSTSGQLNPPIKIVFLSDNTYQIMNANTNAVMEGPITYNPAQTNSVFPTPGGYDPGYRVSLSGNVKAGDSFNIGYNNNVSGDNRNALQFANLYSSRIVDNGNMTMNEAYLEIASAISLKTSLARGEFDSATVLFKQADMNFSQISGVSDIEEMSNLAQYQQSYQACAQVVQIGKTIFDTVIGIMG